MRSVLSSSWRAILLVLALALGGQGIAQMCAAELGMAIEGVAPTDAATGVVAAKLLKQAVELVEPALPPLRYDAVVPVDMSHPDYQVVKYLAERKLLPKTWQPGEIDAATWAAMLDSFLSWYKLPKSGVSSIATVGEMLTDVSTVLSAVSRAIRPAALLATDPADSSRNVFWAVIWNWTIYPRLLVVRPEGDAHARPAEVLERLSNCVRHVTAYISAPEETAKSLFLSHNTSRMFVVASAPAKNGFWPFEVPSGEELDAFAFGLDDLSGLKLYAAVFDGPEVGFGTILGFFWRVRTNVAPTAIMGYLSTPN